MKSCNLIYSKFLDYLKRCGGCAGRRDQSTCKYAVTCAVAEVLHKKGLVKNEKDLLVYGIKESDKCGAYSD